MRKSALIAGLLLCLSAAAQAQDYHQWEIFGGFDYLNANAGSVPLGNGTNFLLQQNGYGWHTTIAENKLSWIGGVMDFSGDYANRTVNFGTKASPVDARLSGGAYPFLFGPRFYYRHLGKVVLFGDALIGGIHTHTDITSSSQPTSETKWAYAFGGGADFKLSDLISLRGQADWIRSHFPETLTRDYQNDYRVSGGIVFTFGNGR
jgi:opacity protein-like surface antigen